MKQGNDMFTFAIASTSFMDFLQPRSTGEQINTHVVKPAKEPQPDFGAMQTVINAKPKLEKSEQ
jgi:hypothetical protein